MAEEKKKEAEEESEKSGLKPVQVIAAALAAVTAAFLGSSLGVYGTVLGAGVISVATTVGSELYLRSLNSTKEATKKAKAKAAAITDARGWQTKVQQRVAVTEQPTVPTTRMPVPDEERTRYLPKPDEEKTVFLPLPGEDDKSGAGEQRAWWKRRMPLLLATSVVAFVIGMFAVTGFEFATGGSLSGEGRSTVGQLVGNNSGQTEQREQPPGQPATTEQQEPTGGPETTDEATPTEESTPSSTESEESSSSTESSESSSSSEEPTSTEEVPLPGAGDSGGRTGGGAEVTPNAVP
ncbi:hypothetical protein [Prauserella cavernicola]|uniref:Uncharacterized protein n=1 Tax=Prauserella cavernicola TaxID=2800127 RepID=A0A934V4E1_9PSEU|nr:hypothetical protein [Prauserella cavernicola]MBK1785322.1 hypothetical protein [Prauserella cavernicola]